MALLAAITSAAATASTTSTTAYPIVLNPAAVSPPPATSSLPSPLPGAWSLSATDTALSAATAFFSKTLASSTSLSSPRFLHLLTSFLSSLAEILALPPPPSSVPDAIRALAFAFPRSAASLAAARAAELGEWDVVRALAAGKLLSRPALHPLVESLAAKNKPELVCLVLRQAADLRSGELLAALRCFLSPASDEAYDAMVGVKKEWRNAALSAIEKCGDRGLAKKTLALARQASVLLMMGHDGFSSPEVCLHYLFGSENADGIVLASAVASLDGAEVVGLVRYLVRWLEKYRRFPDARPCPKAGAVLGLEHCESVPSFVAVARALGVVLDEHFSYLVLNPELRDEIRAAEKVAISLAAEAEACGPVVEVMRRLRMDTGRDEDV